VPALVVGDVTTATMLEPRRTRSVITTRTCGVTTTLATRWPSTRRSEAVAVGAAGFGTTCGTGVAGGVAGGAGVTGGVGAAGGGDGAGGAVTVSACVTAG